MPMLRRFAPVPLALAASLAGQAPVVKTTAEFYPADVEQTHGDERWLTIRIVDGVSGQPIAGAELLLIAESAHPLRGEFWSSMRAVADGDGFVRWRADAEAKGYAAWGWLLVRAKGHGASMFCSRHRFFSTYPIRPSGNSTSLNLSDTPRVVLQ